LGAVRECAKHRRPEAGLPLPVYPLEQTAQAHRAVQDSTIGKVPVDVTA
jgi:NADPH2:quinone reductase